MLQHSAGVAMLFCAGTLAAAMLLLESNENFRASLATALLLPAAAFHIAAPAPAALAVLLTVSVTRWVLPVVRCAGMPGSEHAKSASGLGRFAIGAAIGACCVGLLAREDFSIAFVPLAGFASAGLAAFANVSSHQALAPRFSRGAQTRLFGLVVAVGQAPVLIDSVSDWIAASDVRPNPARHLLPLDRSTGIVAELDHASCRDVDDAGPRFDCIRFSSFPPDKLGAQTSEFSSRSLRRATAALLAGGRIVIELPNTQLTNAAVAAYRAGRFGREDRLVYLRATRGDERYDALIIAQDAPAFVHRAAHPDAAVRLIPLQGTRHLAALTAASDTLLDMPDLLNWKR
ncbi:MAG: hypothetical protein JNG88_05765 [Phycisphaerales bacterium]|nr:hypothetical protein [Phycisphaerales bacterium]